MGAVVCAGNSKADLERDTIVHDEANPSGSYANRGPASDSEQFGASQGRMASDNLNSQGKNQVDFMGFEREYESPSLEHPLLRYCNACLHHDRARPAQQCMS